MSKDLFGEENNNNYWVGLPSFNQEKKKEFPILNIVIGNQKIKCRFRSEEDRIKFIENKTPKIVDNNVFCLDVFEAKLLLNQKITEKTKSIWYPYKSHFNGSFSDRYINTIPELKNKYPIYIVSKGRWENNLTSKALKRCGVDFYVVVEETQYNNYCDSIGKKHILILPKEYQEKYDTCDDFGLSKSVGPGAARNFCYDHSINLGFKKHWVMDDNIQHFTRLGDNRKIITESPAVFRASEDFIDRFKNVPVSGLNYNSFCKSTDKANPYILNTRIYSCLLLDNTFGYRWRGRYNEDTDLSLRVLKDGLCTVQINCFLQDKITTQRVKGGNTEEFYSKEGTYNKSKMLVDMHPDVSKLVLKFGREHHHVNYRPFKNNKLILKGVIKNKSKINNYGMILKEGKK